MGTSSVHAHPNMFSSFLEDLSFIVAFFESITSIPFLLLKLFHVLLYELHPSAGVATVRIDGEACDMVGVHLVDYILQGNHAVFEHPIPGVRLAMTAVVKVDPLLIFWINLGSFCSKFDLL